MTVIATPTLSAKVRFLALPVVRRADLECPLRVDLTRSPRRLAMTAMCAYRTAGVDVKRTLWIPRSVCRNCTDACPPNVRTGTPAIDVKRAEPASIALGKGR
jgi:hypothetical protein